MDLNTVLKHVTRIAKEKIENGDKIIGLAIRNKELIIRFERR